jgi:DNA-binding NarL/FixJ family response regulator
MEAAVNNLKVLVADDHEILRKGVCSVVVQRGWTVVAEATNGREAVSKAKVLRPDIVVMDISMPELNGLEATRQILKNDARCKVLILTIHQTDSLMREILDAGARGYLLKTDTSRDLVAAIESVSVNRTFFTSSLDELILEGYMQKKSPLQESASRDTRLTQRQREILQLLAEGKTSKQVAVTLGLSVKTADTHRSNIMGRLKCHSITELVHYAIRNNVVQP